MVPTEINALETLKTSFFKKLLLGMWTCMTWKPREKRVSRRIFSFMSNASRTEE